VSVCVPVCVCVSLFVSVSVSLFFSLCLSLSLSFLIPLAKQEVDAHLVPSIAATAAAAAEQPGHDAMRRRYLPQGQLDKFVVTYTGFEHAELGDNRYNLVFTSPPFFDFEIYTKLPGQSVDTYKGLEAWLVDFLLASIRKAWAALDVGGHVVIHLTDVYKTKVCEAMCLLVLAELEGAHYEGVLCSLGGMGRPRPLWVFCKRPSTDGEVRRQAGLELQRHFAQVHRRWQAWRRGGSATAAQRDGGDSDGGDGDGDGSPRTKRSKRGYDQGQPAMHP